MFRTLGSGPGLRAIDFVFKDHGDSVSCCLEVVTSMSVSRLVVSGMMVSLVVVSEKVDETLVIGFGR